MNEERYFSKCIIIDTFLLYFEKYLPSLIQSVVFTGRVARQTYRLYVLHMVVNLVYCLRSPLILIFDFSSELS